MEAPLRVVCWGTYDLGKPRNRILLRGLRENNVIIYQCHKDIWKGVEDKSQVKGLLSKLGFFFRLLASYPVLICRYFTMPVHDVVFVGYLGQLDVIVIALFAKLRGVPVVLDVFLSLYDTIVNDRKLISPSNPLSKLLYFFEWIATRCASALILDTRTHGQYIKQLFHLKNKDVGAVFVGSEPECFASYKEPVNVSGPVAEHNKLSVLFYGQFIPLHGIETIIESARILKGKPVEWHIIGQGQEAPRIQKMLDEVILPDVTWTKWVKYEELNSWIAKSDICLGIFGKSGKASRVIPNKIYQVISSGKPVITLDSPAIRELLEPDMENIFLVPAGDPRQLADTILYLQASSEWKQASYPPKITERIHPKTIGREFLNFLTQVT
jgi:glycosyltransferase involved in cell wall biosynthesis